MIRREADGYYVELRATRYGQPVGPVMRWGSYPTRRVAAEVEARNRAQLHREQQQSPRQPRATAPADPPLLAAIEAVP